MLPSWKCGGRNLENIDWVESFPENVCAFKVCLFQVIVFQFSTLSRVPYMNRCGGKLLPKGIFFNVMNEIQNRLNNTIILKVSRSVLTSKKS